jgi:hypothetical protein
MGPGRGGEVEGEVAGDDASDGDDEEVGEGDAARATTKTAFGCARHVSSLRASSGKSWARAALLKRATAALSAGCIGAMVHGAGGDGDGATWGAWLTCMVRGDADAGCSCVHVGLEMVFVGRGVRRW